jgi:hypothetical protein
MNADKAFEGTQDGPVQHHGHLPGTVLGHVLGIQPSGH